MRRMPPLNALKAFEASGRHLTFKRAAQELGVTQGAVSQQVRSLEKILKIKLFNRNPRGLSLTDEGRRYLPSIHRAFDMIAEATDTITPGEVVVTISTSPSLATRWLVPRLGEFSAQNPDIRIRLDASNTLVNFQSDGVDIAIRLGTPPFGPGLLADPLFSSDVIAVCHPDLAQGPQPIRVPQDLRHHVLLEDSHGRWPLFLETMCTGQPLPDIRTMTFSHTSLAIDAALARQGVALTPKALVDRDLSSNRLCQAFEAALATGDGYYIVSPRKPRDPALIATVRDWLRNESQNQGAESR
ncbi:transcriptional regulator GcvA [Aliisedimentitalea scapharcae]|uniref:Transcriptional regulator GcvA n=1 Tax=Aliisedimentitalea scapharcae TaxID=1524259 RepID=A0ABZ2XWA3_9RHOB